METRNIKTNNTTAIDCPQIHTWIKFADDDAGSDMSDCPIGKIYMGIATNKTTSVESNTAADYTWTKVLGDDGQVEATGSV